MKKDTITEEKAKKTPAGGVIVGKREGQTIIHDKGTQGGYFVGKLHKEGGIKGINKSTGQPIEVQGGEVIITAPAVADQTKREFEGEMLTNREILSKINERGGGVSLENGGEIYYNGSSYNYGGKTMTDYEIMQEISNCGCDDEYKYGGKIKTYKQKYNKKYGYPANESHDLEEISKDTGVSLKGLQQIYNKGIGAYKTNPESVRPNVKSKEQWAMARVYSAVMGGKASKIDANELKMNYGGGLSRGKSVEQIADMHNVSLSSIKKELAKGIEVESEHTSDKKLAEKIAKDHLVENPNYYTILDNVGLSDGGEIENLIEEGKIDLKFYETTPSHAREYGIECKNPIYIQTLYITKENRLNGLGKKTLKYLDDNCKKNGNDVIFGHVSNEVEFTKDERTNYLSDVELMKYWLHDNGYAINDDNNDFHKVVNVKYNNGGQLDLVKESKKGDHPARDLNNYNDVMDLEADGQVGMENGLTFDDGGELCYAGGGATLSAEVFEWDKVPTNYRNISKVKKVPFTNNPLDKGLDSIISPFLGKDILRQSVMGVNFDENGITATNLHMLITLPYPNQKYNGIYDITGAKKQKSKDLLLINENYPKYQNIIPNSENAGIPYKVNVYKLLQYTKTAMNYANKTTRAIAFKFGNNQAIGFNGSYLSEVLTAFLKLGYENIYAFINSANRAMLLSPNKNYELGNDDILLLMPVMINFNDEETKTYGAEDIDYKRSLKAYFDFNDSEIHNADGSVAEFKMQYENNLSVDDDYLALLTKITSKRNRIPILDNVKVENGKMTATDLEISLIVKDVNMPDGIYEIVNKAPNITMNPIEDFPSERVFNKNEISDKGFRGEETKRNTAFEFITFSEVFEFYLDKLLLSVGKDDLRPTMSGICIKKTYENEIFLVTTDAHTLCKINITEYCEFGEDNRELEYILPVKYLKDFVKLADGSLHFKCSQANIFIEADNLEFIGRTIDGKYPNYDAVIPRDNSKKIVFDHVAMNKCLKSPEMANLTSKYKGQKDIVFTLSNEGNNLFLKVQKDKGYNAPFEFIDKIQLCEIDFNYQQVDTNISLDKSVFLLMPFKDEFKENQYFAFRKDFFEVMLETITDTEVECYFTEPNRAYIFPIDAIDYKKTLPVEKTKQQKLSKAEIKQIMELEEMKDVLEPMVEDNKPKFEQIIDLGNNFEIRVEKVFYESGDSTYGASLYYKNELFKYFVFLSNTTKKQAVDNVYNYLKTLRVSDKIAENSPKKGNYSVYYSDRGGEHRRIEDSRNEIEQFIKAINSVTNKPTKTNELQEAIETLEMLLETSKGKDKKEIKEALEILKMLNEN